MSPFRLFKRARRELVEASDYYENRKDGLGDEFIDAVHAAIRLVCERPESFPKVGKGLRKARCKRFPYSVYFLVGRKQIAVIAVMHASRDASRFQDFS